jgi:hypothetical protein
MLGIVTHVPSWIVGNDFCSQAFNEAVRINRSSEEGSGSSPGPATLQLQRERLTFFDPAIAELLLQAPACVCAPQP